MGHLLPSSAQGQRPAPAAHTAMLRAAVHSTECTQRGHAKGSEQLRCTSGHSCSSRDAFAHKVSFKNELLIIINKL